MWSALEQLMTSPANSTFLGLLIVAAVFMAAIWINVDYAKEERDKNEKRGILLGNRYLVFTKAAFVAVATYFASLAFPPVLTLGIGVFAAGFLSQFSFGAPAFSEQEAANDFKAAKAKAKEDPNEKTIWEVSRSQLVLYIDRNLGQVRNIFWITIVVMTAGFCLVLFGVYTAFRGAEISTTVLTAASGVITQFIGASFLLIYKSTMTQASEYVKTLEKINSVGMALLIVEQIPEKDGAMKNQVRAELVKQILAPSQGPQQQH